MSELDESIVTIDCIARESVTSCFARGPPIYKSPQDAAEILFDKPQRHQREQVAEEFFENEITEDDLETAARSGRFPYRPSELFLKLFHNVLCTLARDPLCGCVSPCLIGSSGVIPLTIISTIPDIMQHYYHCIIHAKSEVLLATNFWEKSASVTAIGDALRELSRRAGRDNRRVVVKLMIDHPTKDNVFNYHHLLPTSKWPDYDIPLPEEVPYLSLEVNNYHRLILGTFHSKFMVIDRRIALLNSNNIQDRPNLEMMSHFQGDIVNSFYDTFLISWWLPFEPNLVCLHDPAPVKDKFSFGMKNSILFPIRLPIRQAIARARLRLQSHLKEEECEVYLHAPVAFSDEDDEDGDDVEERKSRKSEELSKIALTALDHHRRSHSPNVLVKATNHLISAVVGYDISPRPQSSLTHRLNQTAESARTAEADKNLSNKELDRLTWDFSPFIFHQEQEPFPIVLVNRAPRGTPTHIDIANPQDAAWIGAFRYAKESIFIQTPTLNAAAAVDGVLAACRRKVVVTIWLGLGFNDLVEGRGTFQGGTNEYVVKKLYRKLKDGNDGAEKYLKVYWYTGKDQKRPLHFSQKKRNCHIKFMSIDDQVAIMGNGNMDSQSWYHSQEINAMIDSPIVVKEWMDALYRNQSTHEYGQVDLDGLWRDDDGNLNPNNGK